MPCHYYGSITSRDPKKWEHCRSVVAREMISSGWVKNARKFDTVCNKRAMRLFLDK